MYTFRESGTRDWGNDAAGDAAYDAAMERYSDFLASRDLRSAGDLLLFFGHDFFHDAGIHAFELADEGRAFKVHLEAWPDFDSDAEDLPDSVEFYVEFRDVAWVQVEREPEYGGISTFLYSEIDGLQERIDWARTRFGGEFHSLTIECLEGWVMLVCRSARVTPVEPILWARVMRDSRVKLALYGVQSG